MTAPNEYRLTGIAASAGIASGPAYCYRPVSLAIAGRQAQPPDEEMARFFAAQTVARHELTAIQERTAQTVDAERAAIFAAHSLLIDDPMLLEAVRSRVEAGEIVERALQGAVDELAGMLAAMQDELFAGRAVDVRDVGHRLLRLLLGVEDTSLAGLNQPSIIIAHDLTPSDTVRLDPERTLGFCTQVGGLTSHTTILTRTLGIPAVIAVGDPLRRIQNGQPLIMDGYEGVLVVHPTTETRANYEAQRRQRANWQAQISQLAGADTVTADGQPVEIAANISDVASAEQAIRHGAEGVGLLRTEFLYLNQPTPPTEQQQIATYRAIFDRLGQMPVIVRTLDIGGDKPPAFMEFPQESNPFLGWRAIRVCLDDTTLFRTQLRAILRAAAGYNVRLMFPMINDVGEVRQIKTLLDEVRAELDRASIAYAANLPLGVMIETPAAVMLADALATEVDFFSIGTNDLTQYALAVDRMNERIAHLYQPLHPAALRLIRHTIDAGHRAGIRVGMCGELAGMPRALPLLLGMGLDEFSMAPSAIPESRWLIHQLRQADLPALVDEVLALPTVAEVEQRLTDFLRPYYAQISPQM